MASVEDDCSSDSDLPFEFTIGFLIATCIMVIVTSIISFRKLKQSDAAINDNTGQAGLETSAVKSSNPWNDASCCSKLRMWALDLYARKTVYLPTISHLSDTATDFAAVITFYDIASKNTCKVANVWMIFYLSVATMLIYRIISSFFIWRITRSFFRVLLQFIDIELYHILFVSHRLGLKSSSAPQRFVSVLEAVFEAAPQSMIQIYFLLQTNAMNGVVVFSTILSFINLTNCILSEDKPFLDVKWASPCGKSIAWVGEKQRRSPWRFRYFVTIQVFRILDVPSNILSYALCWLIVNGWIASGFLIAEFLIAVICYMCTKSTDSLLQMIAMPLGLGNGEDSYSCILKSYWLYAFVRSLSLSGLLCAYLSLQNNPSVLLWGITSYFVFASVIKYIIGLILFIHFEVAEEFGEKAKDRSGTVDNLVDFEAADDALELLFYQDFNIKKHASKLYGNERPHSLLALAAYSTEKSFLFEAILNEVGMDDDLSDHIKYKTALMTCFEFNADKTMQIMAKCADLTTFDYMMRRENHHGYGAADYVIEEPEVESMAIFTAIVRKVCDREKDSDKKMLKLLSSTWDGNVLTRAVMWRNPLKCFQLLYELYPDADRKEALEIAKRYASNPGNYEIMEFETSHIKTNDELDQIKAFIDQELNKL